MHINMTFTGISGASSFLLHVSSRFFILRNAVEVYNIPTRYHYFYSSGGFDAAVANLPKPTQSQSSRSCSLYPQSLRKPPVVLPDPPLQYIANRPVQQYSVTSSLGECATAGIQGCLWYMDYNVSLLELNTMYSAIWNGTDTAFSFNASLPLDPASNDAYQLTNNLTITVSVSAVRRTLIPLKIHSIANDIYEAMYLPFDSANQQKQVGRKTFESSENLQAIFDQAVSNNRNVMISSNSYPQYVPWSPSLVSQRGSLYAISSVRGIEQFHYANALCTAAYRVYDVLGTSYIEYTFDRSTKTWRAEADVPFVVECPAGSVRNLPFCPNCSRIQHQFAADLFPNYAYFDMDVSNAIPSKAVSVSLVCASCADLQNVESLSVMSSSQSSSANVVGEVIRLLHDPSLTVNLSPLENYRFFSGIANSAAKPVDTSLFYLVPKSLFASGCHGIGMDVSTLRSQANFCDQPVHSCFRDVFSMLERNSSLSFWNLVPQNDSLCPSTTDRTARAAFTYTPTASLRLDYKHRGNDPWVSVRVLGSSFGIKQPRCSTVAQSDVVLTPSRVKLQERTAMVSGSLYNSGNEAGLFNVSLACPNSGISARVPSTNDSAILLYLLPSQRSNFSFLLTASAGLSGWFECSLQAAVRPKPLWDPSLLTCQVERGTLSAFFLDNGYFIPELEAYQPTAPSLAPSTVLYMSLQRGYSVYSNILNEAPVITPSSGFVIQGTTVDVTVSFRGASSVYLSYVNRSSPALSVVWSALEDFTQSQSGLLQSLLAYAAYAKPAIYLRALNATSETIVSPTSIVTFPVVGNDLVLRFSNLPNNSFFQVISTDRFLSARTFGSVPIFETFPSVGYVYYVGAAAVTMLPIFDVPASTLFGIPSAGNASLTFASPCAASTSLCALRSPSSTMSAYFNESSIRNITLSGSFVLGDRTNPGKLVSWTAITDADGVEYELNGLITLSAFAPSTPKVTAAMTLQQYLTNTYEHVQSDIEFPPRNMYWSTERVYLDTPLNVIQSAWTNAAARFTLLRNGSVSSNRQFSRSSAYSGSLNASTIACSPTAGNVEAVMADGTIVRTFFARDSLRRTLSSTSCRWAVVPSDSQIRGVTCPRGSPRNAYCPYCDAVHHVLLSSSALGTYEVFSLGNPSISDEVSLNFSIAGPDIAIQYSKSANVTSSPINLGAGVDVRVSDVFGGISGLFADRYLMFPSSDYSSVLVSPFLQSRLVPKGLFHGKCGSVNIDYNSFWNQTEFCSKPFASCLENRLANVIANTSHWLSILPLWETLSSNTSRFSISNGLSIAFGQSDVPRNFSVNLPSSLLSFKEPSVDASFGASFSHGTSRGQQRTGVASVSVKNNGTAAGTFTAIANCSRGVSIVSQPGSATLLPLQTAIFNFSLEGILEEYGYQSCSFLVSVDRLPLWSATSKSRLLENAVSFPVFNGYFVPESEVIIERSNVVYSADAVLFVPRSRTVTAKVVSVPGSLLSATFNLTLTFISTNISIFCGDNAAELCLLSTFAYADDCLAWIRKVKAVYLFEAETNRTILPSDILNFENILPDLSLLFRSVNVSQTYFLVLSDALVEAQHGMFFSSSVHSVGVLDFLRHNVTRPTEYDRDSPLPLLESTHAAAQSPTVDAATGSPTPIDQPVWYFRNCTAQYTYHCGDVSSWNASQLIEMQFRVRRGSSDAPLTIQSIQDPVDLQVYALKNPISLTVSAPEYSTFEVPLAFVKRVGLEVAQQKHAFRNVSVSAGYDWIVVSRQFVDQLVHKASRGDDGWTLKVFNSSVSSFVPWVNVSDPLMSVDTSAIEFGIAYLTDFSWNMENSLLSCSAHLKYAVVPGEPSRYGWNLRLSFHEAPTCSPTELLSSSTYPLIQSYYGTYADVWQFDPTTGSLTSPYVLRMRGAFLSTVSNVIEDTASLIIGSNDTHFVRSSFGGFALSSVSALAYMPSPSGRYVLSMKNGDIRIAPSSAEPTLSGLVEQYLLQASMCSLPTDNMQFFAVASNSSLDPSIVFSNCGNCSVELRTAESVLQFKFPNPEIMNSSVLLRLQSLSFAVPVIGDAEVSTSFAVTDPVHGKSALYRVQLENLGFASGNFHMNTSCSQGISIVNSSVVDVVIPAASTGIFEVAVSSSAAFTGEIRCEVRSFELRKQRLWTDGVWEKQVNYAIYGYLYNGSFSEPAKPDDAPVDAKTNLGSATEFIAKRGISQQACSYFDLSVYRSGSVLNVSVEFSLSVEVALLTIENDGATGHAIGRYYLAADLLADCLLSSCVSLSSAGTDHRLLSMSANDSKLTASFHVSGAGGSANLRVSPVFVDMRSGELILPLSHPLTVPLSNVLSIVSLKTGQNCNSTGGIQPVEDDHEAAPVARGNDSHAFTIHWKSSRLFVSNYSFNGIYFEGESETETGHVPSASLAVFPNITSEDGFLSAQPIEIKTATVGYPSVSLRFRKTAIVTEFREWVAYIDNPAFFPSGADIALLADRNDVQQLFDAFLSHRSMFIVTIYDLSRNSFVPWTDSTAAGTSTVPLDVSSIEIMLKLSGVVFKAQITNTSSMETYFLALDRCASDAATICWFMSLMQSETLSQIGSDGAVTVKYGNASKFANKSCPSNAVRNQECLFCNRTFHWLKRDLGVVCEVFDIDIATDTLLRFGVELQILNHMYGTSPQYDSISLAVGAATASQPSLSTLYSIRLMNFSRPKLVSGWSDMHLFVCNLSTPAKHLDPSLRHRLLVVPKNASEERGCHGLMVDHTRFVESFSCSQPQGTCAGGMLASLLRNTSYDFSRFFNVSAADVHLTKSGDEVVVAVDNVSLSNFSISVGVQTSALRFHQPRISLSDSDPFRLITPASPSVASLSAIHTLVDQFPMASTSGCSLNVPSDSNAIFCISLRNAGERSGVFRVTADCGRFSSALMSHASDVAANQTVFFSFLLEVGTSLLFAEDVCSFSASIDSPSPLWSSADLALTQDNALVAAVEDGAFQQTCAPSSVPPEPFVIMTESQWVALNSSSGLIPVSSVKTIVWSESTWAVHNSVPEKNFTFSTKNAGEASASFASLIAKMVCEGKVQSQATITASQAGCNSTDCTFVGSVRAIGYYGNVSNITALPPVDCILSLRIPSPDRCWMQYGKSAVMSVSFSNLTVLSDVHTIPATQDSASLSACSSSFLVCTFGETLFWLALLAIFMFVLSICLMLLLYIWKRKTSRLYVTFDNDNSISKPVSGFKCSCGADGKFVCFGCGKNGEGRLFCGNEVCWNWEHSGILDASSHIPQQFGESAEMDLSLVPSLSDLERDHADGLVDVPLAAAEEVLLLVEQSGREDLLCDSDNEFDFGHISRLETLKFDEN
eukprot:ANDGO_02890.mRNA.1 hypothetical protein